MEDIYLNEVKKYDYLFQNNYEYGNPDPDDPRFVIAKTLLGKIINNQKIIDVGVGSGTFYKQISSHYDTWGIEPSRAAIEKFYPNDPKVKNGFAHNLPKLFDINEFDTVISLEVLEHIPPAKILENLTSFYYIGKKYFIFSVANHEDIIDGLDLHINLKSFSEWDEIFSKLFIIKEKIEIHHSKSCVYLLEKIEDNFPEIHYIGLNENFFSVVVPLYNHEKFIIEALDTLKNQTYQNWEAIIVNDGSTDNSQQVVEDFIKNDSRFKLINQNNGGVSSALNTGIKNCKYDWVCWLSSDDWFENDKLEIHNKFINFYPGIKFFHTKYSVFYANNNELKKLETPMHDNLPPAEFQSLSFFQWNPIIGNSICIQKEVFEKVGYFNGELRNGQDFDFWLRCSNKYKFHFISSHTCKTRWHDEMGTVQFPEAGIWDSAWSIFQFINKNSIQDMFPLVDNWDTNKLMFLINKIIDISVNVHSYIYAGTNHKCNPLLERLKEFLSKINNIELKNNLSKLFLELSNKVSRTNFPAPIKNKINELTLINQTIFQYKEFDFFGIILENSQETINQKNLELINIYEKYIKLRKIKYQDNNVKTSSKKLFIISQNYNLSGGTENLTLNLADSFTTLGTNIEVVFINIYNDYRSDLNKNFKIHFFNKDEISKLINLLNNNSNNVILLCDFNSQLIDILLNLKSEIITAIYLNTNNQSYSEYKRNKNLFADFINKLKRINYVTTTFEGSFGDEILFENNIKFTPINLGIRASKIEQNNYFNEYFGINNSKKKVIYPALVAPLKQQNEFINIISKMVDIDFIFVGDIFENSKDYANYFRNLIIQNNNCYHFESVPNDKLLNLISSSDLVVLPSISEGAGLILLEAIQLGIPWLASDKVLLARKLIGGKFAPLLDFEKNIRELVIIKFNENEKNSLIDYQNNNFNIDLTAKKFISLFEENSSNKRTIIVAADLMKDKDLTQVDSESDFRNTIFEVINKYKPSKLLETGTYLGEGTTRIIIEALQNTGINNFEFYSIEINPNNLQQARFNLDRRGLLNKVNLMNGLSVPKKLLPTLDEINKYTVENIEFNNIIIDHHEQERALRYYQETNFIDAEDDLIDKVLQKFNYEPDFILLDSAGHIGNIEFNYAISKIKIKCIIALDDANHLKHYKSYLQIKDDKRFRIIKKSDEKFGFVVAEFTPDYKAINPMLQLGEKEKQGTPIPQLKLGVDETSVMGVENEFSHEVINPMLQRGEKDFSNKKILIVRTDSIGDAILSIGIIKAIKEQFPNSNITVLVQEHLFEIYELCPYIDNIISVNKDKFYIDKNYRNSFINDFHKLNYDYSINTIYSRDLFSDVFATAANIDFKIAFDGDLSNNEISTKSTYDRRYDLLVKSIGNNVIEFKRYIDLSNALGIQNYDGLPWIWFNEKTMNFAENFYKSYNVKKENVIILFAGGQHSIRDYIYFSEALNNVTNIDDYTVIAIGGAREFALHQDICKNAKFKYLNLCGKLTLIESASLVYHSKFSIGTETSFSHIACAVDKPNITILGGGHFGRFLPYHELTSLVYLPLECFHCNWKCKFDSPYCITEIDPEIVTNAINDVINGDYGKIYQQLYSGIDKVKIDRNIELNNFSDYKSENVIKFENPKKKDFEQLELISPKKEFKVSALVSIYKSERFMNGLMEDLTNQTLFKKGELEIILIDSNSPENEFSIIEPFLKKYPSQIIYKRTQERETLYKAWNRAILLSSGQYLTNANTDDRHRIDALEIMAKALDEFPEYDLVYPDLLITENENETFDSTNTIIRYEYPDFNLGTYLSNSIFGAIPMWRKSVHDKIGYFDENYKIGGDYEFFIRLAKECNPVHLRETLGLFLQGRDSLTNSKNVNEILDETYSILKKHRRNIDLKLVYPKFIPEKNDLGEIISVLWDYGVTNMLSPYQDFENTVSYFNKCLEISSKTSKFNIIQEMYNNNLGIIYVTIGKIDKGLEMWEKSKDNSLIQTNLQIHKLIDTKPTTMNFQTSLLSHPVLDDARATLGLYLDENMQLQKSDKLIQFFWDVYYGNNGIEISESELINAKKLKPRSPKSQGYLKSYHQIIDEKFDKRPKENLTSLSKFFWERDYSNKKYVLIKTPSAIGDSFAITTIINNLKIYFPHLNITVACGENEKQIYLHNPQIDKIIKNNCYDSDIFEIENDALEVIDYNHLISNLPEYYNGLSYLDIFANIAGIKLIDREYHYYIQSEELEIVKDYIGDYSQIIALHLNTAKDKKRTYHYPNELVIELLNEYPNCQILNLGQVELEINNNRIIDAAKLKLNLREQIALSSFATDFITIDSSFFHVGHNLFKKNTYTIFGPTNPNLCGNPENKFYVINNREIDCLNCYWSKDNKIKCMNELTPKSIIEQIKNQNYTGKHYSGDYKLAYNGYNYEEFIFDFFKNKKIAKKILIEDKNNLLPDFAINWNGIEVIKGKN